MREVRTFTVSEESLEPTLKKFNQIASRGKAKGLQGGFTILGVTDTVHESDGIKYFYKAIEVECEPVKFAGWEFLAVAEVEQGVVLTKGIGSGAEVKPSQVKVGHCDHCQTIRARKNYIFVTNEAGEIKQVGSTCVKDFLGWEFTPSLPFWGDFDQEVAKSGATYNGVATEIVAAVALMLVAKEGYKSAKTFGYGDSTGYNTLEVLNPIDSEYRRNLRTFYGITFPLTDDQFAKGQELIEFAKTFAGDSAYAENLRAVATVPFQNNKTVNLFVSAIIVKQKEAEKALETKKEFKTDQYAPTGDRVELTLKVVGSREIAGFNGTTTIWTFEGGDYRFKWFDSGYTFNAEIGDELKVKGTIKGLDEYKGLYSTLLTRVKKIV